MAEKAPEHKTTILDLFLVTGKNGQIAVNASQLDEYKSRDYRLCIEKDMRGIPKEQRARFSNPGVSGCQSSGPLPAPTSHKAVRAAATESAKTEVEENVAETGNSESGGTDGGTALGGEGDGGDAPSGDENSKGKGGREPRASDDLTPDPESGKGRRGK